MITDPDQVEGLIDSTATLIEEDGMDIALFRTAFTQTEAGGIKRSIPEDPLEAVRRYFGAVTTDPPRRTFDEGEQVFLRHVLIGMPGDDMQEKDTFSVGDRKFRIMDIDPGTSWQTKGWCVEYA